MDFVQLRMFCSVAETGSLARSAELLHRVPSNLTTRLRQLEEELGTDLFIREKQRLRLSPMGHNFLNYAQRILSLSDEAMNMAHAGKPGGQFHLGAMESTAATRLPGLLATFHQRFPTVMLSLVTGTSGEIIAKVREGTLAAALVDGPVHYDELNGCISYREQMVLVTSLDHPPVLSPKDAQHDMLFAFGSSCSYRQRLEAWFREGGVQPAGVTEIQSYHAMMACVAAGGGLAMMTSSVLALMPDRHRLRVHPLPAPLNQSNTWLIWRRDAFTANVEALKYLIIEQFADKPENDQLMHPLPVNE